MAAGSLGTITKDPADIRTYSINWAAWLGTDTISTATWTVPTGLTSVSTSNTTTVSSIKLSGGTNGHDYTVACTVLTVTNAQTKKVSFILHVETQ